MVEPAFTRTQGFDVAQKIQEQFERNERRRVRRRQSPADRERYALISMQRNLQTAIERHAARLESSRLAGGSEVGASWRDPERGAERRVEGPQPPSFAEVGPAMPASKKPIASETASGGTEYADLILTDSIGWPQLPKKSIG